VSEINELIHKSTMFAYDQGVEHERERIIKLLTTTYPETIWARIDRVVALIEVVNG